MATFWNFPMNNIGYMNKFIVKFKAVSTFNRRFESIVKQNTGVMKTLTDTIKAYLILILSLLLAVSSVLAGNPKTKNDQKEIIQVEGIVIDESGKAIPGAMVYVYQNGELLKTMITNSKGRCSLEVERGEQLSIQVEKIRYCGCEIEVDHFEVDNVKKRYEMRVRMRNSGQEDKTERASIAFYEPISF